VDFVVDEDAQPPVITTVSPLIVSAGTAVTVTGDRLYPTPDQTRVSLNGRQALPTAIANAALTFPVPAKTGSGKVSVTTAYGRTLSGQDVIVAPTGISSGDIVAAGRLIADGPPKTVSVSTVTQSGALLFDGTAGAMTSLQFSGLTGTVNYTLYGPNNLSALSGSVSPASPTVHLPRLTTASYLLLMKPSAVPAAWDVALETDKSIAIDGDLLTTNTEASQSKRYTFTSAGSINGNLGFGLSQLTTSGGAWSAVTVYVYRPDGSQLTYETCYPYYGGCDLNLLNLSGGTYSLVLRPSSATMSFRAGLSTDVVGTLLADAPRALTVGRPGQNGLLTFAGVTGQTVALNVSAQTTVPANQTVYYTVYKPDGSLLQSSSATSALTLNLAMPASGNYTVFVDPNNGETLTAQIGITP